VPACYGLRSRRSLGASERQKDLAANRIGPGVLEVDLLLRPDDEVALMSLEQDWWHDVVDLGSSVAADSGGP